MHIDVTLTTEQYARIVREAERRGLTLAGYVRQRAFDEARDEADVRAQLTTLHAAVQQLSADLRALVHVIAGATGVITDAGDDDRETILRTALELYDRERSGR